MHKTTIGLVVLGTLASGCGGGGTYANKPRPPAPINVAVYIANSRVSVSPASVGAGPIVFIVTNQASTSESMAILPAGSSGSQPLAHTAPINPQGTTQVSINFTSPGDYTVATTPTGSTDAALASPSGIQPAVLHVGAARPGSSGDLLTP